MGGMRWISAPPPTRLLALGLAASLTACHPPATPAVAFAAAEVTSIAVFHRDIFDLIFSGVTGRDCSIVRLDENKSYCRPIEPPPPPPEYCTRSLGTVDCWAHPELVPNLGPEVADGPSTLTPAQERNRTARWPDL